jgi:hypothetical protein
LFSETGVVLAGDVDPVFSSGVEALQLARSSRTRMVTDEHTN